ncbi:MAG: thioredoxin domain-containing protein [Gammaproteobacteria bacterium]|nr:thioredoxin domain-containing protein [Gammaproteobacteria bacterium]
MQIRHRNPDGTPRFTNALAHETSPYLRKHAHDPVQWYAWGPEALARARREDKPIHLSVGYASCHWCSVLHEESFLDEATAALLNEHFVNIKVDREERPDLDRIYQTAQQMLTQRGGGWPLTMFLTPEDQRPFFGGTYFPREPRHGLPAFGALLQRVAQYYRSHGAALRQQNETLMATFAQINPPPADPALALDDAPLRALTEQAQRSFDAQHGGFGGAPKFPQPQLLAALLRRGAAPRAGGEPGLQSLYMGTVTLRHMAAGGIQDQLGGGFYRYAVDASWRIPHFEKMLYDNAALLALYAQAARATGEGGYADAARRIVAWANGTMRDPGGAYYASLDADSEGHEGKFYVWDREAVRAALTAAEFELFAPAYGLDEPPNFEGAWHLYQARSAAEIARRTGAGEATVEASLESAREKLRVLRESRPHPARDEKLLTAWNALMIRGLALAARALDDASMAEDAAGALAFVRRDLWRDGRLLATSTAGQARLNAYLDDYAYLADAVLELQQVRCRADELAFLRELLEVMLAQFADPAGGFFFTSADHETLIHRSKVFGDEATPSGNGIAARVLIAVGHLLGEPRYLEAAERTVRSVYPMLARYPLGHASMLLALEDLLEPPQIVILRGRQPAIEAWRRELARAYAPQRLVLAIPADASDLPPALAARAPRGEAVAYLCRGPTCSAPLDSLAELRAQLEA